MGKKPGSLTPQDIKNKRNEIIAIRKHNAIRFQGKTVEEIKAIRRRSRLVRQREYNARRKPYNRALSRKMREQLSDWYIAVRVMELPLRICPPQLIAAKRAQLKLKRLIKQIG